jgi:predicted ATPase/DNA-binding SARP family transcriptional activator
MAGIVAVQLFGRFGLAYLGEQLRGIRAGERRTIFAFLCLTAGTQHERRQLAQLCWPDLPDPAAQRLLRQSLYRLRGDLAERGLPEELLISDRTTVGIDATLIDLDVVRYETLWQNVQRHRHSELTHCISCMTLLREMAVIYRGPILADGGMSSELLLEQRIDEARSRCESIALRVWQHICEADMQLGDFHNVAAVSAAWIAQQPWDEQALRYRMRALALVGERGTALSIYRRSRQLLRRELDIEPEAATSELAAAIREDRVERWFEGQRVDDGPQLIGREEQLNRIVDALVQPHGRCVTIVGLAGAGKSTLADAASRLLRREFSDGVVRLSLREMRHSDEFARRLAQALGIAIDGGVEPLQAVSSALKRQAILIVLDNAEVLAEIPQTLRVLLDRAPQVRLLCTSRIPLLVDGEWLVRLLGLQLPEEDWDGSEPWPAAVQLMVQRMKRLRPESILTREELVIYGRLARQVGGLPAGLELAVNFLLRSSAHKLSAELLRLGRGETDAPELAEHRRQIDAILTASMQLLSEVELSVLAQASIFRSGFDIQAAHAVIEMPEGAARSLIDILFGLVDRTLLQINPAGRFFWHRLVQRYAADELARNGQAEAVTARHAEYFSARVNRYIDEFRRGHPRRISALDQDFADIRAAWEAILAGGSEAAVTRVLPRAVELLIVMEELEIGRSLVREAVNRLELQPEAAAQQRLLARVLGFEARFAYLSGCSADAEELSQRAVTVAERAGDAVTLAYSLVEAARVAVLQSDYRSAQQLLRAAETGVGDCAEEPALLSLIHGMRVYADFESGDISNASALVERILMQSERYFQPTVQAAVLVQSSIAIYHGDYGGGITVFARLMHSAAADDWKAAVLPLLLSGQISRGCALLTSGQYQQPGGQEWSLLLYLGTLMLRLGEADAAIVLMQLAVERRRSSGGMWSRRSILSYLARAYRRAGNLSAAETAADEAYTAGRWVGDRRFTAHAGVALAQLHGERDPETALALLNAAIATWQEMQRPWNLLEAQSERALLHARAGRRDAAMADIGPLLRVVSTPFHLADEPLHVTVQLIRALRLLGDPLYRQFGRQVLGGLEASAARVNEATLREWMLRHPDIAAIHRELEL